MNREEKCQLAIEKGITYNPETGEVIGMKGNVITRKTNGYISIALYDNKKIYQLYGHQFAYYITYGEVVDSIDHINGIKDDNRICNLRSVTHQQNSFNIKKAKGYYWDKLKNKWHSQIQLNGKQIHLGLFNTEDDAHNAYLQAKQKYHII
jgi:hypothetical protein